MTRPQAETWSTARSLAFLAATFAIVLGTLLPFGAMAAARPGETLILCSSDGPQTIQIGGDVDGPGSKAHPAKCAACVMPLADVLPPPAPEPCAPSFAVEAVRYAAPAEGAPPPARAPPRPPSTAPPLA